jgi:RimJ/RimL family protein N-acetyltransferase
MTNLPPTTLPRTTLTGDGVILRQFTGSDAADVVSACNDAQTARFLPMLPQPYTIDDAMFYLRTIVENNWETGGATFAIADPATGRLLGSVGTGKPRAGLVAVALRRQPRVRSSRGCSIAATDESS